MRGIKTNGRLVIKKSQKINLNKYIFKWNSDNNDFCLIYRSI